MNDLITIGLPSKGRLKEKSLSFFSDSGLKIVESEFWPRLIFEIKKQQIPLGLINARMEKKTFENWLKIKTTSMQILNKFDFVYSNDHLSLIHI